MLLGFALAPCLSRPSLKWLPLSCAAQAKGTTGSGQRHPWSQGPRCGSGKRAGQPHRNAVFQTLLVAESPAAIRSSVTSASNGSSLLNPKILRTQLVRLRARALPVLSVTLLRTHLSCWRPLLCNHGILTGSRKKDGLSASCK